MECWYGMSWTGGAPIRFGGIGLNSVGKKKGFFMDLKGVYTAIVTPFRRDGGLDEAALRSLIEAQIEGGVSGLVPCGTTGESPTLNYKEHDRVIEISIAQAAGRVPIIAGTGSNSTAEAVRLSLHAAEAGADALLLVNPYYNKPTQKGLFYHFREIANAVSIPCVLYNIKGRTGVNLETDTLVSLTAECKNIKAVKEASGSLAQMKAVLAAVDDDFRVLSGDDNMTLDLIRAGGHGVISVASNLVPGKMSTMVSAALNGDMETAEAVNEELKDLFSTLFIETNPIPVKTALAMMGKIEEVFRLPMCELSTDENRQTLEAAIRKTGLI
jgi:4-hydroxy-tetrahydrodipicolinate synthase